MALRKSISTSLAEIAAEMVNLCFFLNCKMIALLISSNSLSPYPFSSQTSKVR